MSPEQAADAPARRDAARRRALGTPVPSAAVGRIALVLVLAAASGARAQDLPDPEERWVAAGDDRLLVLGQVQARRVEGIARDLLWARAAVLELVGGAADPEAPYAAATLGPVRPVTAIVFRDDDALLAYHREPDGSPPASLLLQARDRQGRILALSLESLGVQLPLARAALAADLLDQLLVAPPGWLRTGLEGLVSRLEPQLETETPARVVERLPVADRRTGSGGDAPAADPDPGPARWPPPDELARARRGEHAGAAVGLVRHLASPLSERSSQLRRYLTLLRGGLPSDAAIEECFFRPFPALYREVAQVAARGGAPPIALELPRAAAVPAARAASYAEVALVLGDLLVRAVEWNTVAAELHLRAALADRPDDASALRDIARVRELDRRQEAADELWERSLAAAPSDRLTAMLWGWSRLERFRRSVGTRRGWEEPLPPEVVAARELFRRAIESTAPEAQASHAEHLAHGHELAPPIAPDASPYALQGYGATYLYARDGFDPGLSTLERASQLRPGDDQIAADYVALQAHAGNLDLAWELRRERLLDRVDPALDAEIESLVTDEALRGANHLLLVDQRPAGALAMVRTAFQESRDPARRAELERLLGQMEQVGVELERDALHQRFVADYERARELVGERRFDEARRLLEPWAVEAMEPTVRDPAREALSMLERVDR